MEPEAYPGAEDTHLLIDILKQDEAALQRKVEDGGIVIEIGSGSGDVSVFLNSLLGRDATFISTDVNTTAIDKTQAAVDTARADVIRADLFSCFRPGSLFEIVVFNPPYVPTDEDEFQRSLLQRDISASWAGGRDGREVTDRFLLDARNFMRDDGVIYLVIIDLNDVEATMTYAKGLGYQCEIAGSRLAGIEKLYILRLHKAPNR